MGNNYNNNNAKINNFLSGVKNALQDEPGLIYSAKRDPLTDVYDKFTAISLIKGYLRTDGKENGNALILMDVDNFGHLNERFGKSFGDNLLSKLSTEMRQLFRSSDVIGRVGGDKFILFLRGIKQKKHISDKIRDIYTVIDLLDSVENDEKITVSLGVSTSPDDGDRFDVLFKKASTALYSSKSLGKNRVTFFSECNGNFHSDISVGDSHYYKDYSVDSYNSDYDSALTDFAFDAMNKTRNISNAVSAILQKVGNYFDLSRISVMETDENSSGLRYTYQWCIQDVQPLNSNDLYNSDNSWYFSYDDNDINAINDLDFSEIEFYECKLIHYKKNDTKALLECAIYDSGEYFGHISFMDCKKTRYWTLEEVKSLKTITKIISFHLLKIRAIEKAERLIEKVANYDVLTNLPKLNIFKQIIAAEMENSTSLDKYSLLSMDFNNFKYINEKLGYESGDKILLFFATELTGLSDNIIAASRMYSDKFIILVKLSENDNIFNMVSVFSDAFSQKVHNNNPGLSISLSTGIYNIENSKTCIINNIIDNADIARRKAKELSENNCVFYNEKMKKEINALYDIIGDAKEAILNKEFVVFYQPKMSVKNQGLSGAEALIRWKKLDGTMISPNDFIPCLEKSGFIVSVDFYVLEKVCEFLQSEMEKKSPIVPISVNFSRLHVRNQNFVSDVHAIISKYEIPTKYIEIELTENAFLEDQQGAINIIKNFRELGFHVSIDDFGSGYSSLNLLKYLPVNVLKLDKEFFMQSIISGKDEIIISSMIDMASKMNVSVVCEGVETEEQMEFLKSTKCASIQGYYYSKPIPEEEFIEYKHLHSVAEI